MLIARASFPIYCRFIASLRGTTRPRGGQRQVRQFADLLTAESSGLLSFSHTNHLTHMRSAGERACVRVCEGDSAPTVPPLTG